MMARVYYVDRLGGCAAMLKAATPPVECGSEMPIAPARGPMVRFTPREIIRTDAGNYVSRKAGYLGRDAARVADAFDLMELQARRAHRGDASFVSPFTPGQVSAGREYAALSERVAGSGVKCSSLEVQYGGSSGGGDREAAQFRDADRLRQMHRRIGDGLAKEVRRVRPGGDKRRAIYVRRLVDLVCLSDMTLNAVLEAHHWGFNVRARDGLRLALCGALDRLQGYDLVRSST